MEFVGNQKFLCLTQVITWISTLKTLHADKEQVMLFSFKENFIRTIGMFMPNFMICFNTSLDYS